jgi:ketosteroid isomerase-like protein
VSSANLDLVRSIYAAWERGDFSSAEWADPEIEFIVADGPEPFTSTGVGALAGRWRTWLAAWENYRVEADEFRELDDESVLVLGHYGGRGKTSGLEIAQMGTKTAVLFDVRRGKVAKFVAYNDRERAFADLGLGREGDSP